MIDRRARREESDGRDRKNRPASRFANQPMARGGARIFLVYGPIGQTIEEHGGRSRQNHADQDEKEERRAGPAICRDEKRAQGKRQGEDRVGKTDQSEEASANILSGGFHPELVVPKQLLQPLSRPGKNWRAVRKQHPLEPVVQ